MWSSYQQHSEQEQFACGSSREEYNKHSEACDFIGDKCTFGRETVFFSGIVCDSWGGRSRVSVSAVSRLDLKKKVQEVMARARFAFQNVKNWSLWVIFGRWGRQNKCAQNWNESSMLQKIIRNWHVRSSAGFVWWSLANVGRFGVTLLLCGFATECDETHSNCCVQQSMSDAENEWMNEWMNENEIKRNEMKWMNERMKWMKEINEWNEMTWHEMKWHDMKWNEMNEMKWHEMKWHEMKWMKWNDMTWNEMKGNEIMNESMNRRIDESMHEWINDGMNEMN